MFFIVMTRLVITRESYEYIRNIIGKKGIILYGRRKTGKTFFIKNLLKEARYFYVYRNKEIFDEKYNRILDFKEFQNILREINDIIIIDEFHRLGDKFLDFLHNYKNKNKLILITSTLHYFTEILGKENPILGYFVNVKFDLPKYKEIIKSLVKHSKIDLNKLVEYSIFLKEISFSDFFSENFDEFLYNCYLFSKTFFKNLLFEIFNEEERELTKIYYSIILAIANGYNTSSEISSKLYSLEVIEKDNPSLISPHLKTLEEIGIIRKVKIYGKRKRYLYYLSSIPMEFFLYLYEKYNLEERDIDIKTLKEEFEKREGLYVERFFAELISEIKNLPYETIKNPSLDIDFVILDKNKNVLEVYEVKLKEKIKYSDIKNIIKKFDRFKNIKKFLIVKDKNSVEKYLDLLEEEKIKALDLRDIIHKIIP